MRFSRTALPGVVRIEIEREKDGRGYFARTWCDREAKAEGLRTPMVQDSIAFNERRGTLRGLHYHPAAFPQARLIRCMMGAAFVAAVDLRPQSGTYLRTVDLVLDAESQMALYVAHGLALGYQTLADRTVMQYKMPEFYDPRHERGVRWNDGAFGIAWPDSKPILNDRDAAYPDFDPESHRSEG
jgi:dTDP-4-dehydrorhamnose 3,5-epimerase